MTRHILKPLFLVALYMTIQDAFGQSVLASDQNPSYAVSRDKYMKMSDSLNTWHSTTQEEMYKAIDWLQDRKEARADRREFRQQLRTERARNSGYYYGYENYNSGNYYYPNYRNGWGNNYRRYNNYGGYYRNNSLYVSPWGIGYYWR